MGRSDRMFFPKPLNGIRWGVVFGLPTPSSLVQNSLQDVTFVGFIIPGPVGNWTVIDWLCPSAWLEVSYGQYRYCSWGTHWIESWVTLEPFWTCWKRDKSIGPAVTRTADRQFCILVTPDFEASHVSFYISKSWSYRIEIVKVIAVTGVEVCWYIRPPHFHLRNVPVSCQAARSLLDRKAVFAACNQYLSSVPTFLGFREATYTSNRACFNF
jgi:hypothetical protein